MTSGVLIVGSLGLSLYTSPRATGGTTVGTTHSGRDNWLGDPFLQEEPSPLGEVFGWIMAGIYMGGRVPQIWLNVKNSPFVSFLEQYFDDHKKNSEICCVNLVYLNMATLLDSIESPNLMLLFLDVLDQKRHSGGP